MKGSRKDLLKALDTEDATFYEAVWEEMHIEYDIYKKQMDFTPLLKGLPNDRDPCPHWGIVLKGQMRVIYDGKEEVIKAGEAYYMPPGHTGIVEAGTEAWEFSPNDKLQESMKIMMPNYEKMMKEKKK
jgi:hypothetical protein